MHRAKVRCPGDSPPGLRHGRQESAQVETARGDVPDVGVDGSGERGRGAGQLWHPRVSGRPRWQASARVAARRSFEAATRTGSSPGSGRIHRLNGRAARLNGPFLGANTMYWQIRLAGLTSRGPRTLVGYRTDATLDLARTSEPSQATGLWRDSSRFPPENAVTGMQYECFPVDAPYRVVSPRWWGFAGPSVKAGTAFPHLVGVEADRVYPIRSTPRPLQVLSHATYSCRGVRTSTESTYYTTRSGSGAFNAGTLHWTCALRGYCHPDRMSPSTQSGSPGKSRGTYFGSSPRGPLHAEIPQLTTSAGATCHE